MNTGVTEDGEEIFFKEKDEGNILTGKFRKRKLSTVNKWKLTKYYWNFVEANIFHIYSFVYIDFWLKMILW